MRCDDRWKILWNRPSTWVLLVFSVALLSTGAGGQERPDFSGVWTSTVQGGGGFAAGGTRGAGSLGSGWGSSFTIEQGADMLTVTRVFFSRGDLQPPLKFRFALNGSETRNVVLMGRGMQEQLSTTAWDGDNLVITTLYDVPKGQGSELILAEVTQTLSLRPPSAGRAAWPPSLVLETVRGGVLGGPPSTTRTVYNRE
jgi:hypothetical protein